MNLERARAFLLDLPYVNESMQWGDNLIFRAGEKAVGGKMFALINLSGVKSPIVSYLAGADRFAERIEQEGISPAPYFARIFWVAARDWHVHRDSVWAEDFRAAHAMTLEKLAPRTRSALGLPPRLRSTAVRGKKPSP